MTKTIDLPESQMRIQYRVIAATENGGILLLSTPNLSAAENLCWSNSGKFKELKIEKVWIYK